MVISGSASLKSKFLYKVFLVALKYIPVLVTLSYVINTILCWFNVDLPVLSNISGMSLLTWLFMYIATYVFKFCNYHRLLLYFILVDDSINIYDYYFTIPLENHVMLELHTALVGILVIILLINHVKSNKKSTTKYNSRYRYR